MTLRHSQWPTGVTPAVSWTPLRFTWCPHPTSLPPTSLPRTTRAWRSSFPFWTPFTPGRATVSPSSRTPPSLTASARTAESIPTRRTHPLTFPSPPPWCCSDPRSSASASWAASVSFANLRPPIFCPPDFPRNSRPRAQRQKHCTAVCHPNRRVHEACARAVADFHGGRVGRPNIHLGYQWQWHAQRNVLFPPCALPALQRGDWSTLRHSLALRNRHLQWNRQLSHERPRGGFWGGSADEWQDQRHLFDCGLRPGLPVSSALHRRLDSRHGECAGYFHRQQHGKPERVQRRLHRRAAGLDRKSTRLNS